MPAVFGTLMRQKNRRKGTWETYYLKMLYLVMMDITKKWTGRRIDWGQILAQPYVYFEDRIPE